MNDEEIIREVNISKPIGKIYDIHLAIKLAREDERKKFISWLIRLNHDLKEFEIDEIYITEGYKLKEWINKKIKELEVKE